MNIQLGAVMLALAVSASAQGFQGSAGKNDLMKSVWENRPNGDTTELNELKGVTSWKTLADVKTVKQKDRFIPEFGKSVATLDKQEVRIQGFMMPLDMGERQKRFILAALPPTCSFCLPGGPEQMVEVQAKTPVKYGFEPIVVSGRFTVLRDDAMGLYYRLTDAVAVAAPK